MGSRGASSGRIKSKTKGDSGLIAVKRTNNYKIGSSLTSPMTKLKKKKVLRNIRDSKAIRTVKKDKNYLKQAAIQNYNKKYGVGRFNLSMGYKRHTFDKLSPQQIEHGIRNREKKRKGKYKTNRYTERDYL